MWFSLVVPEKLGLVGASSSYSGDFKPERALPGVSGFWHSAGDDKNPWIAVKMPYIIKQVIFVDVIDRSDCCKDRFKNVEVRVSTSNSFESGVSCGKLSYQSSIKYRWDTEICRYLRIITDDFSSGTIVLLEQLEAMYLWKSMEILFYMLLIFQ